MDKITERTIAERDDGVQVRITINERYIAIHPDGAQLESRSTMDAAVELADMHWLVPSESHEPDSYRTPEVKHQGRSPKPNSDNLGTRTPHINGTSMVKRHRLLPPT